MQTDQQGTAFRCGQLLHLLVSALNLPRGVEADTVRAASAALNAQLPDLVSRDHQLHDGNPERYFQRTRVAELEQGLTELPELLTAGEQTELWRGWHAEASRPV